MMLAALNRYYQHLADRGIDIPAPGYSSEKISYCLVLDATGQLVDVELVGAIGSKGKIMPTRISVPSYGNTRTSGIAPNFLWDKTSYVLGISAKGQRNAEEHAAFADLHRQVLARADDAGLQALLRFLERWSPADFETNPVFAANRERILDTNLVFRLDGPGQQKLHERPAARAIWSCLRRTDDATPTSTCLVTGQPAPATRLHPMIKGVKGAKTSGASIVSFNLEAFASYGKDQGDNAPVSEEAVFGYTTALNYLLRGDTDNRQRILIGDTTVVFWAEADTAARATAAEGMLAAWLAPAAATDANQTHRLSDALDRLRRGLPVAEFGADLDPATRIHVLGLSPNAARLAVRFWITSSLDEFVQHLARHFADLRLEPPAWQTPPSVFSLALATAPRPGDTKPSIDDISPRLEGELLQAILTGQRYPRSLLTNLIMRFRADGKLTGLRVALVKAVLIRNARINHAGSRQGEDLVSLDLDNAEPGYLLGRLFATLESTQYFALDGKANATIRDRYFGAASATPASIFPVLLRNAQNHLGKLRKTKAGLAVNLEKQVSDIIDRLPAEFPRHLAPDDQGRFAIGYYHQQHASRAKPAAETNLQGDNA